MKKATLIALSILFALTACAPSVEISATEAGRTDLSKVMPSGDNGLPITTSPNAPPLIYHLLMTLSEERPILNSVITIQAASMTLSFSLILPDMIKRKNSLISLRKTNLMKRAISTFRGYGYGKVLTLLASPRMSSKTLTSVDTI
jgi:hypothetical protein